MTPFYSNFNVCKGARIQDPTSDDDELDPSSLTIAITCFFTATLAIILRDVPADSSCTLLAPGALEYAS